MLHTLTLNIIHDEPVSQPGTYPTSINAHSLDSIFYHHPGIPDSPGAKGDWLVSSHRWSGNERLCIEFPSGKRVLGGGEDPPTTTKKNRLHMFQPISRESRGGVFHQSLRQDENRFSLPFKLKVYPAAVEFTLDGGGNRPKDDDGWLDFREVFVAPRSAKVLRDLFTFPFPPNGINRDPLR